MDRYVSVSFTNFKAYKKFRLELKHFNILAGPNNAGKSTILASFRILSSGIRKASSRKAIPVMGPDGPTFGYDVDLDSISIAEENIFHNYDDSSAASVQFNLTGGKSLTLYFAEQGKCVLIANIAGRAVLSPAQFKSKFDCAIGFVPILGPVEHQESLYEKEAARSALYSYRAARNFRNIWYHYPEKFSSFKELLKQTWPGMDIQAPETVIREGKTRLYMFCPEERIPRELFWSGFGFQVWCQMLTHLIQSKSVSIFLIDEPDIYLHSDLQRQLLGILRDLGPDILIATHSLEILTEAETNDLILINKNAKAGKRIRDPSQLHDVFSIIGSSLNPTLTQLAKTRRALFVEGKDFKILGYFAKKLKITSVFNRRDFAVIPVEGFNPQKIKNLKQGIETTLGTEIVSFALLDRDYRCDAEVKFLIKSCKEFLDYVWIHDRKGIENFLLVPEAIDRVILQRSSNNKIITGRGSKDSAGAIEYFTSYCHAQHASVLSRVLPENERFERSVGNNKNKTTINEDFLQDFIQKWEEIEFRLAVIGGKAALSSINNYVDQKFGVSLTAHSIISSMNEGEIPSSMKALVHKLDEFSHHVPGK